MPPPRIAVVALACLALSTSTHAFDWAGKIAIDAAGLEENNPSLRREAVERLAAYPVARVEHFLLRALADPDWNVRLRAARVLGTHGVEAARPTLITWLTNMDPEIKIAACELLGELASTAAIPDLVRSLGDVEATVRLAAVQALGQIGTPAVISPLIGRSTDSKATVRQAAAATLGRLKDPRAVIPLVGLFADPSQEVREAAIEAVGTLGSPAPIPALLRVLDDRNESTRICAIRALGDLGAGQSIPKMIERLPRETERAATQLLLTLAKLVHTLGTQSPVASPREHQLALVAVVEALSHSAHRAAAREAVAVIGRAAVPALVAHLEGRHLGDPQTAVQLLRDLGDPRATTALLRELSLVRVPRSEVIAALGSTGDATALPTLLPLLADDDPEIRRATMHAIHPLVLQDSRSGDVIEELLSGPDRGLRPLAARYLGEMKSRGARDALLAALNSKDPTLQREVISALAAIGDPETSEALIRAWPHAESALHAILGDALAQLGRRSDVAAIEALIRDGTDPGPAIAALGGILERFPHAELERFLLRYLDDPRLRVAQASATALASAQTPPAREALRARALHSDPQRARIALLSLASRKHPRTLEIALLAARASDDGLASAATLILPTQITDDRSRAQVLSALSAALHSGKWATEISASAAFGQLAGEADLATLDLLLDHGNPLVRANAARILASLGAPTAVPRLWNRWQHERSPGVRRVVARALLTLAPSPETRQRLQSTPAAETATPFPGELRHQPDRSELRIVIDKRSMRPAANEPYVLEGADDLYRATYTDSRGRIDLHGIPATTTARSRSLALTF